MTRPDEIAALADAKASLADHVASFWKLLETETVHLAVNIRMEIGHEAPDGPTVYYDCTTFSDDVAKELVRLSATPQGDAVRDKPVEDSLELQAQQADEVRGLRAALAPAEKAGDDEGFGSVRGKLDHLGRRVDAVDMPQALKDSIARCYGLLWMLETEDKRAHRARRGLLSWLTKDEQVWGIENAKAICLMNGLDDGSSQKDCPGTATPTPPSAGVDETGWLIEKDDPPVYHLVTDDYDEHWTTDASKALRFARREDVQAYVDHVGWTSPPVRVTEHMWPIQSAVPGGGTKSDGRHDGDMPVGPATGDGQNVAAVECLTRLATATNSSDPAQEPEAVALKPCPFCGGQGCAGSVHRGSRFAVDCTRCGSSVMDQPTIEKAIELWNTRPSLDREAIKEELRQWHRDTCYPDASKHELDIGLNRIIALIGGRT